MTVTILLVITSSTTCDSSHLQRKSLDPRFIGGADGATRTGYRFVEELRKAEYEKAGKELQELKNNGLKMTPEMIKRKEDLLKIRQEYVSLPSPSISSRVHVHFEI